MIAITNHTGYSELTTDTTPRILQQWLSSLGLNIKVEDCDIARHQDCAGVSYSIYSSSLKCTFLILDTGHDIVRRIRAPFDAVMLLITTEAVETRKLFERYGMQFAGSKSEPRIISYLTC